MRRKILSGVLACAFLSTGIFAFANRGINIIVNDSEISNEFVENQGGRVTAPVRAIAEALGAEVYWDGDTQSVIIKGPAPENNDRRIELLEQALKPAEALSAVNAWAEAVKSRNGALQFALFSDKLKAENKDGFSDMAWTTGTSSPWVKAYEITELAKHDDSNILYRVVFTYTDSASSEYQEIHNVSVKKNQEYFEISDIETLEAAGEITEIKNSEDGSVEGISIENKSKNIIGYDKANVIITRDTKIFEGYSDKTVEADALKTGAYVEVDFKDGPRIMIYPVSAEATTIRIIK